MTEKTVKLSPKREKILRKNDGTINEKQLKLELKDFDGMVESLQAFIYNVFGLGNLYIRPKKKIESMREKRKEEIIAMEVQDIIISDIKNMETKKEIIEYLEKYYNY